MQKRARAFVLEWQDESSEHAEAQSWWNDFFEVFGVRRKGHAAFEWTATRASTGGLGSIDVFMPGVMLGEHKSLGKGGDIAVAQALDYLAGGDVSEAQMPRYVVTCDFAKINLRDLESDDPPLEFPIKELPKHVQKFAFLGGYEAPRRKAGAAEAVSIKAAREMAKLQQALYGDRDVDPDSHEAEDRAIFMTRLLFLLYADDVVGLWEPKAFERYIRNHTVPDGSDTGSALALLFQLLDTAVGKRSPNLPDDLACFPYVNGHIFEQRPDIPYFTSDMRSALLRAVAIDWSGISPAIFGSLFQGLSTREERRASGEHYTSETNILKLARPLFLDELEDRLQRSWSSTTELKKLRDHLGELRFLDPACGCGNFLIIAYREVANIEFRILARIRDLQTVENPGQGALDPTWDLKVTPDHFSGIETGWWPAKIAETAMFLTQHLVTQHLAQLGEPPSILPITRAVNIVHGNALRLDWSDVLPPSDTTYVYGNPPFLGHATRDAEQAEELRDAWGRDDISRLDYVTAWHAKTLAYLGDRPAAWAFVSTNSITQGDQVPRLFRPIFDAGWRIKFAHRTFAWGSEASGKAAVHCVIVGFARPETFAPRLFVYDHVNGPPRETTVARVNPYLADAPDVLVDARERPLSPQMPSVYFGAMPRDDGNLVVEPADYATVVADPIAAKYVRPYRGSQELLHGQERWCLWLTNLDPRDLATSPVLKTRIAAVRAFRAKSSAASTRQMAETPHLFGQRPPEHLVPYLCIPRVVSENYRRFPVARFGPEVITSDAAFTADDPDGFAFAIVSSAAFLAWQKAIGGRLKSDMRFGATLSWNNFPLPNIAETRRQAIIEAGAAVLMARTVHAGASLSDLYNAPAIPSNLLDAHKDLDRAVDAALGFRKSPTSDELLARLFDLYADMTGIHA